MRISVLLIIFLTGKTQESILDEHQFSRTHEMQVCAISPTIFGESQSSTKGAHSKYSFFFKLFHLSPQFKGTVMKFRRSMSLLQRTLRSYMACQRARVLVNTNRLLRVLRPLHRFLQDAVTLNSTYEVPVWWPSDNISLVKVSFFPRSGFHPGPFTFSIDSVRKIDSCCRMASCHVLYQYGY